MEKENRATAFEKMCSFLMANLHILVGSRIVPLDRQLRMVMDTHVMIGAPKKTTEAGEEAPIDAMQRWLSTPGDA
jgi:hypothetical protein